MSHDLRNPLNVAKGHLELAREGDDGDHLATVGDALDRMDALIEDLRTLTRQGQPIEGTEEVHLSSLADRSWEMVQAPGADFAIEDDLTFEGDPDRCAQLLENLFRNAVEHGPGIPEDDRVEVFESGYSTADDGTGLGLSIVSEVADAHGWSVRVDESEWGGTRVEITGV